MENNMDANVKDANSQNESLEKDYKNGFIKNVHHIGRVTMLFALLLSFAPILYFILVKGYTLPIEIYLGGIAGVFSIGIGMWLTEPEAYWPVLGSAGTYISYLSGNVGAMRFPVASTVQKDMKADASTPRGQIITIVGITASVVVNLIILLLIVLLGDWVLKVIPAVITGAFSFVVVSMLAAMIVMNIMGHGGVSFLPTAGKYIITAVVVWYVCNKIFPYMFGWGMALAVGLCVFIAYIQYRSDMKKEEDKKE